MDLAAKSIPNSRVKSRISDEDLPEAGMAFYCDERGSYHAASAKDAWEKTKSFFRAAFKVIILISVRERKGKSLSSPFLFLDGKF